MTHPHKKINKPGPEQRRQNEVCTVVPPAGATPLKNAIYLVPTKET